MNTKEMRISHFIQDITQDILCARTRSWLKVAIISHAYQEFPEYSKDDITTIVEQWYAGAYK